jgi:hypothetical protein
MLQDFQAGLEPQLINKDAVEARVKRMLLGDENMAAMATSIAQDLATQMNIPLQQALQATQATIGGGTGAGGAMASQFSDAALQQVDSSNTGASIVTATVNQMKTQYPLLSTAGADAGRAWGDGFTGYVSAHVPAALISVLVNLVTPGVVAQLNQRATLTTATP